MTMFMTEQAPKHRSYASSKLCPLTGLLTGVRCRATNVAKNHNNFNDYDYDDADENHMEFDYLRQELFRLSCAIIRTCALTHTV